MTLDKEEGEGNGEKVTITATAKPNTGLKRTATLTIVSDGYETEMGQGGVNVSGGQKQRLCIARALLKKPKVLILDDSTSAVDTATEGRIRKMLAEYLPDMTKIIIAQRISSVRHADQIIILDDGKVNDMGTHEELLARNEIYQQIYESQKEGAEL